MEQQSSTSRPQLPQIWIEIQESLKKRLIQEDCFTWKVPQLRHRENQDLGSGGSEVLKFVGGVDLSFSKNDPSIACASLVVLDFSTLEVVYEDCAIDELRVPYVPGFLAFREAPVLIELLEKMQKKRLASYPQVLMVDGNGLLHPRGFGLACHLGVLADLPTIGIGKNLHHVDGLSQHSVRKQLEANGNSCSDIVPLIGNSGSTLGAAMRSTERSMKPIFISVGHRISLATATLIVKLSCKFRVPEPIRQADIRSKIHLQKHGLS
ncbi:endonuclease V family protein [Striga hermonthica]|uniref:Endonuclease V family protein n=1 Tax=Striga hermonthica TaxID=68872 RepID=A0A9N7MSH2_STRHE|nr:endonuclease V family protein [Striga hermonthica]